MRILVAEDNLGFRLSLESVLSQWGYEVTIASDGLTAWEVLKQANSPPLAVLDWVMPGMTGLEVCTRIREEPKPQPPYLILLTGRVSKEDTVAGLDSGADDYLTKPVDFQELRARVNAGRRIVNLQQRLAERVSQLEEALGHVEQLQGLLPICCYCKKNPRRPQLLAAGRDLHPTFRTIPNELSTTSLHKRSCGIIVFECSNWLF